MAMWIPSRFVPLVHSLAAGHYCATHLFASGFLRIGRATGLASESDINFLVSDDEEAEDVMEILRVGEGDDTPAVDELSAELKPGAELGKS